MVCVVSSKCECTTGGVVSEREKEGADGSIGCWSVAMREAATIGQPQLLTQNVQRSSMADKQHVVVGRWEGWE